MNFVIPILPLIIGFLLDALIGDPYSLPHPIRLIGRLISALEKFVRAHFKNLTAGGVFLAITVLVLSAGTAFGVLFLCYRINILLGIAVESVLCYYMTAARCLQKESMKVYSAMSENDTEKARKAVSMIVGRDT
ncbi:MAG: cobalamin biosynthesis protein, partial [Oscillospiraceae bacterium]|nr:cobalamin biosynthesis protein [Oscillospiraceae bacterium]